MNRFVRTLVAFLITVAIITVAWPLQQVAAETAEVLVTAIGAGTFTVPMGVTEIIVEAWGAGGNGGGRGFASGGSASGGGGGAYAMRTFLVQPGEVLSYHVGRWGGASWFGSNDEEGLVAAGGSRGSDLPNEPGAGGSVEDSHGDVVYKGGDGLGSRGGGGAGSTGPGQDGREGGGATEEYGGAGGAPQTWQGGHGNPGELYGGGGGGARGSLFSVARGGPGAQGLIRITWDKPSDVPDQYDLTISGTAGGWVTSPGAGTQTYDAGTVVNLVATAAVGHHFVNWTGEVSTIANVNSASTTITMNDDYSILANFEPVPGVQTLCVESATGTGEVCFTTSHGFIEELTPIPALSPAPSGVNFPHGMFEFKIIGLAVGAAVTLTIELPEDVPDGFVWWKHDGTGWYSLPNLDDNGDNIIVIELTDGGLGDTPDSPDGEIHDPGGPGNPMSPMTVGWEGSSVDRAAVIAPWIALLAAIAGASFLILRRRQAQN